MSNVFDLDSIREALDNEFKPVIIKKDGEEYVLRNLMRMSRKDRKLVMTKLETLQGLQGDDEESVQSADQVDEMQDALADVISTLVEGNRGRKLVAAVGDDLQLLGKLVEHWQGATQAGEASNSPS